MPLSVWIYILIAGGVFIATLVIWFILYSLRDIILSKRIKKNIPTDKDILKDPGDVNPKDIREEEENERKRFGKFREFEKLRRIAQSEGTTEPNTRSPVDSERIGELQERSIISDESDKQPSKPKRKIRLD